MPRILFLLCYGLLLIAPAAQAADSLNLEQCIRIALEQNPDMQIARKELQASQAAVLASYGGGEYTNGILPSVSVGAKSSRSTQGPSEYYFSGTRFVTNDTTAHYHNAGVSVSQNLFDGGRWWNNIKLAKLNYRGQHFDTELARQVVIANVTEKFYTVLKAEELLNAYEVSLKNSREQLHKTREMHRIGQVAKKDLFKAQVNEGNDRLNVIQQKSALKAALADLNLAIGLSPDKVLDVFEKEYREPAYADAETAYQKTIANNQEYNSLIAQKQVSHIRYKMSKSTWFPTLSTSFSYYRGGPEMDYIYTDFDKWWNTEFALNMSFPIFNGFRRKTNIQRSYLDYKSYDDRMTKKEIELKNQVKQLILELDTYREMIEINELNIQSAREDLRLAREMYRLNSATLLEVLDAQVALTRAQTNLINTKYDAKIAEARLNLLIGSL